MNIFVCIFNVLFAAEGFSGGFNLVEVKKGTKLACRCRLGYGGGGLTSDLHFTIPFVDSTKGSLSLLIKHHSFMLGVGKNIYKEGDDNKNHEYRTKTTMDVASLVFGSFTVSAETDIMSCCTAASNHSAQLLQYIFKGDKIFTVEDGTYKVDKNLLSGVQFIKIGTTAEQWFYVKQTTPISSVGDCCLTTQGKFLFVNSVDMLKAIESSTKHGQYMALLSYEHMCEITVTSENAMLFVSNIGKNVEATGKVETTTK